MFRWCVLVLLGSVFCHAASVHADNDPEASTSIATPGIRGPLEANATLAHFKLAPGLKIELAAQEPQVIDPVAVRFDSQGRMWVVEMRDYPNGPKDGQPPTSQIKILQDLDHDGFFETAGVFADNLLFANGIQPWKSGVIATVGGRVVYMPDDDADGKADRSEPWYEGFAQQNSQLRANHPTLAIDNQVYVANGLRGGTVVSSGNLLSNPSPISISGMDFRFDPLSHKYEAISGVGQFGLTFDELGNRFVCTNRNPLKHIVLPNHYLRKNPSVPAKSVSHDVALSGPDSKLYPLSRAWTTSTLHANQFTAACGVTIYSGDALPAMFHNNAFTCDPTGNLVHREVLKATGATFVSKPGRDGVEFLASPDEWFRPVNLENGPDGALYVVDMYRAVIEHPQFVPAELKNRPDQRYGENRGRIYRIRATTPKSSASEAAMRGKDFLRASEQTLVNALASPNSWHRQTAARLILENASKPFTALLREQLQKGPETAKARCLWLLQSRGELQVEDLVDALRDASPMVKIQALRLSERFSDTSLRNAVRHCSKDNDPQVRYQAAVSLAPAEPQDAPALAEIAWRGADDSWTRQAIAIAAGGEIGQIASVVLKRCQATGPRRHPSTSLLASELVEIAARRDARFEGLLSGMTELAQNGDPASAQIMLGFIRGASRSRVKLQDLGAMHPRFTEAIETTSANAQSLARDKKQPLSSRRQATEFLGAVASSNTKARDTLSQLALGSDAQETRIAAIGALSSSAETPSVSALLAAFPSESPAIRRAILDLALARSERVSLLLDQIQAGQIKLGEIDRVRTNRLLKIQSSALKPRIAKLFASAIPQDRRKVLQDYQAVLKLKADPRRGELVFRKNCATCHRVGKWGVDVAPDIADSRTRQPAQLLTDILQPNRAIDSNYISYSVITNDGLSLTGVLAVETSDSITLKLPEGKSHTLARSEIEEMRSNGVSLMPEGLEKNIDKQQMADLISYVKNWRYLDGLTPYAK